jgi:hypothetical protein
MRKSKAETAKTRERIVKAAGAEFAANGISEAALARVMAAAGLSSTESLTSRRLGSLWVVMCRALIATTREQAAP